MKAYTSKEIEMLYILYELLDENNLELFNLGFEEDKICLEKVNDEKYLVYQVQAKERKNIEEFLNFNGALFSIIHRLIIDVNIEKYFLKEYQKRVTKALSKKNILKR